MDTSNLTLLGTSHISKESVHKLHDAFLDVPDMVCLELDKGRFTSLVTKKKAKLSFKMVRRIGVFGFLFALVGGWVQKKLGKMIGTDPGVEMIEAINLCKEHKLNIHLIDQRIDITLRRLSRNFSWRERFRLVYELVFGIFKKKKIPFDIRNIPDDEVIEKLTEEMRLKFPNLYTVLVHERNVIMARRLARLLKANPDKKILAVVGAGHVKGMRELLDSRFE